MIGIMFRDRQVTTPEQQEAMGPYGVMSDIVATAVGQTAVALEHGNGRPTGPWWDEYRRSTFMFDPTDDNRHMAWALSTVRAAEAADVYTIAPHDQHHLQTIKHPDQVIQIGFGGDWSRAEQPQPGQHFAEASRLALFARVLGKFATEEHEAHTVVLPFTRHDLERWNWPNSWELASMTSWIALLNKSVMRNSNRRSQRQK